MFLAPEQSAQQSPDPLPYPKLTIETHAARLRLWRPRQKMANVLLDRTLPRDTTRGLGRPTQADDLQTPRRLDQRRSAPRFGDSAPLGAAADRPSALPG